MNFTSAQLAVLKTDIVSSFPGVPNNPDRNSVIAAAYTLAASPDFWVWRTRVSKDELVGSLSVDGTSFSWVGAGYITRAQGERDAFNAIFDSQGQVNPSIDNVRTAFGDIFSGAVAPAPANRTHLLTVARRKATRLEKLFSVGTGSTAVPAKLVLEGNVTYTDIGTARES